jgi:hypothetical protein
MARIVGFVVIEFCFPEAYRWHDFSVSSVNQTPYVAYYPGSIA